jgi:hypothetical protein
MKQQELMKGSIYYSPYTVFTSFSGTYFILTTLLLGRCVPAVVIYRGIRNGSRLQSTREERDILMLQKARQKKKRLYAGFKVLLMR